MHVSTKQKEAIQHIANNRGLGILWWKTGEGKTRIALGLALFINAKRCIIICPAKAIYGWQEEIQKNFFSVPHKIFSADSIGKIDTSESWADTILIVDELHYFSNMNAARSKKLKKISKFFPYRLGMTATTMPTADNITIWGQLSTLNFEKHLAPNVTAFRDSYQEKVFDPFSASKNKQVNKPGSKESIIAKLSNLVHCHFPDNEHRNIRHSILHCKPTKEQTTAISQLRETYRLELEGETLDFKFATQVMLNINRIANGWISREGEFVYNFVNAGKLQLLLGILSSLHANGDKAIIWCHYLGDVDYLYNILPYRTLKFIGGQVFDIKAWDSGKYPFVIATAASGTAVNYFAQVEYAIYYSLPFKLTDFEQSKGRTERKSSQHIGAFYYYLLMENSFDEGLYEKLNRNLACEQDFLKEMVKCFLEK